MTENDGTGVQSFLENIQHFRWGLLKFALALWSVLLLVLFVTIVVVRAAFRIF